MNLLSGCTTVVAHKSSGEELVMTQDEFAKYTEQVFKYHNQVMTDLIEAAGDRSEQEAREARELNAAEKKMVTVCEPLNEIVSESLSGESVGLKLKTELLDTVPACEEATKTVDKLIP